MHQSRQIHREYASLWNFILFSSICARSGHLIIRGAILRNAATTRTNDADSEVFAISNRSPIDLQKKIPRMISISTRYIDICEKTKNKMDMVIYNMTACFEVSSVTSYMPIQAKSVYKIPFKYFVI